MLSFDLTCYFTPFEVARSEMCQDLPLRTLAWEQERSTWSFTQSGVSLDLLYP